MPAGRAALAPGGEGNRRSKTPPTRENPVTGGQEDGMDDGKKSRAVFERVLEALTPRTER